MNFFLPRKRQIVGVEPVLSVQPKENTRTVPRRTHDVVGNLTFRYTSESWDGARRESKLSKKPIFLVFHEAGIHHAENSFETAVSHPLLVEAIETLFVPVLVPKQTKAPADTDLLKKFTINSQSRDSDVRIVDYREKCVVSRIRSCGIGDLSSAMAEALEEQSVAVPFYLRSLVKEYDSNCRVSIFGMPCFWDGEVIFAKCEGVEATRAGWIGSKQCVEVTYDAKVLSYSQLVRHAINNAADVIYCHTNSQKRVAQQDVRKSGKSCMVGRIHPKDTINVLGADSKHYLSTTSLLYVPLTGMQALQANFLIANNDVDRCSELLSPRQLSILNEVDLGGDESQ